VTLFNLHTAQNTDTRKLRVDEVERVEALRSRHKGKSKEEVRPGEEIRQLRWWIIALILELLTFYALDAASDIINALN
jgi:hypothetical protein